MALLCLEIVTKRYDIVTWETTSIDGVPYYGQKKIPQNTHIPNSLNIPAIFQSTFPKFSENVLPFQTQINPLVSFFLFLVHTPLWEDQKEAHYYVKYIN